MFSKLVGNEPVKKTLRRFIEAGRVPNSLIFAGDEGIGKRHFALEIARAFICHEPTAEGGCGVCTACERATKLDIPERGDKNKDDFKKVIFFEHLDVGTVVRYKQLILVDAIRDLERHANFRPYEAKARFFIIDEADRMNAEASNALLKTLEEPPSTSYIFLITSRPDRLLPTIRSRCQIMRFAPVETDAIERYLIEQRAFMHDEARLASRLARGSIGRAVSINVGKFKEQRERMLAVLKAAIEGHDIAAMLQISEQMNDAKNKDSFEENLSILESLIHDIWTLRIDPDPGRIANTDVADDITRLAQLGKGRDLAQWMRAITELRENLVVNINRRVATDALFATMAA